MFVKKIESKFNYVNRFNLRQAEKRTTTYGKLSNGNGISVDNFYRNGKIIEKRFVIWGDTFQRIINKVFNPNTNKFDRIG